MAARSHHFGFVPGFNLCRGLKVGLLGGSFNPAHGGHLHISLLALKRLRLDFVWWLVSPGNPLKDAKDLAPLSKRLEDARKTATHPRIAVRSLEERFGTRYTVDTLRALDAACPNTKFVWLMGADNMIQLPEWKNWIEICELVPIAVFDRPGYSLQALNGKMATRFQAHRRAAAKAGSLADQPAPAWTFIHCPKHPAAATEIRNRPQQKQSLVKAEA